MKHHKKLAAILAGVITISASTAFAFHSGGVGDSEGLDLQILRSNDWSRYRPTVIVAEFVPTSDGSFARFLDSVGYGLIYYNGCNGIFHDRTAAG